jgi:23S rRNA (guanosine2251-2'-O)-methyltransferase
MPAPKPRKGNRGQAHRDQVARKQQAERTRRAAGAGAPAAAPGFSSRSRANTPANAPRSGAGRAVQAVKRGLGGEQVEGRRAVRELLLAGRRRVRDVWLAEGLGEGTAEGGLIAEIVELAADARVPVRRVARTRLDAEARTDAPQGVLAHAEPLPETDIELLVRRRRDGQRPFLLALDGITDPHNLGALLRTATSAGVTGVVLPRHRAAHITATVAKAAAGAIEHLPMSVVPGLPAALAVLKDKGVWTIGLDADAEASLFDPDALAVATEPVAIVLGAEGSGLSRLVRQRCDLVVSIPMRGAIESLNVSAAGALALYEVARRRA